MFPRASPRCRSPDRSCCPSNVITVTALHSRIQPDAVTALSDGQLPALRALLDADPYVNAMVASRVGVTRTLAPGRLGGTMLGVTGSDGLRAACYDGGNLIPIGGDAASWDALATQVAQRPRACTSVVGRAEAVEVMWSRLSGTWGPARSVRSSQPLLLLDRPPLVPTDPRVRLAEPLDFNGYLLAATQMFTEELGVEPRVAPGVEAFRARVAELIRRRRAFVVCDADGQIEFKAEIGAVSAHTAQLQGVWVRPDLRGRGIGTAAVASVCAHALALAPTVSLYVNDYNVPALRLYSRLGMRRVATLATVLLA